MLDNWGCGDADTALVEWMQTAEIGDYHDHRLGVIVRLKDARNSGSSTTFSRLTM
jgi:hypothetical protein